MIEDDRQTTLRMVHVVVRSIASCRWLYQGSNDRVDVVAVFNTNYIVIIIFLCCNIITFMKEPVDTCKELRIFYLAWFSLRDEFSPWREDYSLSPQYKYHNNRRVLKNLLTVQKTLIQKHRQHPGLGWRQSPQFHYSPSCLLQRDESQRDNNRRTTNKTDASTDGPVGGKQRLINIWFVNYRV